MNRPGQPLVLYVGGAAYALVLAALVLTSIGNLLNRLTVRLYVIWRYDLRLPGPVLPETFGFVLNVLLFVPVGLLLALCTRWPWWVAALGCVLASACIEGVQALPMLNRDTSISDVISNGLGGLAGVLLAAWWSRRAAPLGVIAGGPR